MSYNSEEFDMDLELGEDGAIEDSSMEDVEDADDTEEIEVEQQVIDKKAKKKDKKDKKNKSKTDKEQEEPEEIPDKVLYVVTDRLTYGLLDYMRNCGLNVANIYDNIDTVRNMMIMQMQPLRIVVIDSGTGKFITPTIRKDLIDMIGMADEDIDFTIFYTDSIIKSNTIEEVGKDSKNIEWFEYESTSVCVANIMSHKENYIMQGKTAKEIQITAEDILRMKGTETPGYIQEKQGRISLDLNVVADNINNNYEPVMGFEVDLR